VPQAVSPENGNESRGEDQVRSDDGSDQPTDSNPVQLPELPEKAVSPQPAPEAVPQGATADAEQGATPGTVPIGFDFSERKPGIPEGDRTAAGHVFVHDYAFPGSGFVTAVEYLNDKEAGGPERPEAVDLLILRPVDNGLEVVHRVSMSLDDEPPATDGVVEMKLLTPLVVERGYVFAHWQSEPGGPIPMNLQETQVEGRSAGRAGFDRKDVDVGRVISKDGLSGGRDYFLNLRFRPSDSEIRVVGAAETVPAPVIDDPPPPPPQRPSSLDDPFGLPRLPPAPASATRDDGHSEPAAQPRWDEAVDLLKLIDVNRDRVSGVWRLTDGKLESNKQYAARIEIPYQPPEEYVLTVIAEPLDVPNGLILGQRSGARRFLVLTHYTGPGNKPASALENIDGRNVGRNETTVRGPQLTQSRASTLVVTVRRQGVTVTRDGRPLIDWHGTSSQLSLDDYWKTPHENALFLGAYDCRYRFSRVSLTPIVGTGRRLRSDNAELDRLFSNEPAVAP
jgi:hypothetical protein